MGLETAGFRYPVRFWTDTHHVAILLQMSTFLPLPVDRNQSVFTEGPSGNAISTSQLARILKMYDRSKK